MMGKNMDQIAKINAAYELVAPQIKKLEEFEERFRIKNPQPLWGEEGYWEWNDKVHTAFQVHDPASDAILSAHFASLCHIK